MKCQWTQTKWAFILHSRELPKVAASGDCFSSVWDKGERGEVSPFLAVHRLENTSAACAAMSLPHPCRGWLCPNNTSRYCFGVQRDSWEPVAKRGWALHWAGVRKLSVFQDGALAFDAFQCVGRSTVGILLASTLSSQIFPENWAKRNTVAEREQLIKPLCAFLWCRPRQRLWTA